MTETKIESKWIFFFKTYKPPARKTDIWKVLTKDDHLNLGEIRWFGRWRGFAFFPAPETVFEKQCLRDIAGFIDEQNKAHKITKEMQSISHREFE